MRREPCQERRLSHTREHGTIFSLTNTLRRDTPCLHDHLFDRIRGLNEIASEREEIARALEAEGFHVVQAASAGDAVREIWAGSFIAAVLATILTGTTTAALQGQLAQMAPEIEVLTHGKNDELPRLVKKACEIRDGVAAA